MWKETLKDIAKGVFWGVFFSLGFLGATLLMISSLYIIVDFFRKIL